MDKNITENPPGDKIIEDMLGSFAPEPSERFQAMMSSKPWQKQFHNTGLNPAIKQKTSLRLIWAFAILGVLLVFIVIMFVPSVRAAASQIFHLFLPASSDQINVQVTLSSPGDLVDFSNPGNFSLSIEDVQQLAGFDVKQISVLPAGLAFIGSRYDPGYKTVTVLYEADEYKLFLTQRPLGKGNDVFSIGSGAVVHKVKIGDIDAEFVVGGWKAVSTEPSTGLQTPTEIVNLHAIWDNDYPQFTLRWQAQGFIYELRSTGAGSPSQSVLINLANELK